MEFATGTAVGDEWRAFGGLAVFDVGGLVWFGISEGEAAVVEALD